jgi:diguanylate cyclase (GGDEF)-like protein
VLARFFGGARARREGFDMNRRLASSYPAITVVLVLSAIPGIVHYHDLAGPVWQLAGFAFFGALALPSRTRRPELTAIFFWLLGIAFTMLAGWVAGPPLAYLWAAAAISLPVMAVIWPLRVVLVATVIVVVTAAGSALLIAPDEVRASPPSLALPLLSMILCAFAVSVVAAVDRRNRRAAVTDTLTGLGNRSALAARVEELAAADETAGRPIALVVVDLDHFKSLNDEFGHAQGDAALRRTAIALSGQLGRRGRVYRYGGEEFVALLPATNTATAKEIADELRTTVSHITIGGKRLSLSGGCATAMLAPGFDLDALFRRADKALFLAKEEGRNRINVAPPVGPVLHAGVGGNQATQTSLPTSPRQPARPDLGRRLVRTRVERDHLRAVVGALYRPLYVRAMNWSLLVLVLLLAPWVGWGPAAVALVGVVILDPAIRASTRTLQVGYRGGELAPLFEAMTAMALVGAAIVVAKGNVLYALPLIISPATVAIAGYRRLGALIVWFAGAAIMTATAFLVSPTAVAENPMIVSLPIGLLGCIAIAGSAIAGSAMEYGAAAVVDPLTGALNRSALEARLPEIAKEIAGRPVTLMVADLDHFKVVNDTYGHDAGDAVLVEVARRLQDELRSVDVLYRVGGEEFVVLLAGTDETEGTIIAERLRVAIGSEPVAGHELTISLGVAAARESDFDYASVFDRADAALFEAKRTGRDRVAVAEIGRLSAPDWGASLGLIEATGSS